MFVLVLLCIPVLEVSATPCGPDEFECYHRADGCIPLRKVYDGEVDCLTDGHDESSAVRQEIANLLFSHCESK